MTSIINKTRKSRFEVILGLVLALTPVLATADEKRAATIDDLMAIRTVMDPHISPDGRSVAYVVSVPVLAEDKHNSDIWLVSEEGGDPIQLSNSPEEDSSPRWSPDGKTLAFMSARGGAPQIYLINPRGGEAKQLTTLEAGVQSFAFSPQGDRILFLSPDAPTEAQKTATEESGGVVVVDGNITHSHLHIVTVDGGNVSAITSGEYTVAAFDWSPDGKDIVFARQPTPAVSDSKKADIYRVSAEGGDPRVLVKLDGADGAPKWSPDGKTIVISSEFGESDPIDPAGLGIVDASGGEVRRLAASFQEAAAGVQFSPDGQALYFFSTVGVGARIFRLSLADDTLEAISPASEVNVYFDLSADGKSMAYLSSNPQLPPEVFTSPSGRFAPKQLTHTNPELDALALGSMEAIRWESSDGMEIEGILLKPAGYQKGERYPLLTYVHGGPSGVFTLAFGPQLGTIPFPLQAEPYPLQAMAGEGFVVFMPNPRGSSGYGRDFLRANVKDWGYGDFNDIQSGIDHLIAQGIADADRLGLMGWSYGGYMTAWAISQTNRFKAASMGAGLSNLYSMHGNTDISDVFLGYMGERPWNAADMYDRSSAMRFAQNIVTPTLIQHGEKDDRVQVSQAWEMYRALQSNKVPVSFAIYPGQGHLITTPKLQKDMLRRNLEWFGQWVLGER